MLYLYLIEALLYVLIIGVVFAIFKIKKVEKLKIVIIILPILMLLTLGITFVLEKPEIKIDENISYEVGKAKSLDKISAKYHFIDVSEKVKIEGNIDFNKVGKYEIKYVVPTLLGN